MTTTDRRAGLGRGAALKRAVTEAHQLLDDLLAADMAALGLSVGEADVLTVIHVAAHDPLPGEIADWLGLTGAGTTGRLKTLEARGLLERRPNPADGRSVTVHLTGQGARLAEEVVDVKNTAVMESVIETVGDRTATRVIADLDSVIAAAREILDSQATPRSG